MKNRDIDNANMDFYAARVGSVPEYVTCPHCGLDIEFWTAADVTRCYFCGHKVFACESTIH